MPSRPIYAIVGVFVGAAVDLFINLLAAAIQQRAFADQFNKQSVWWLVAVIVGGLLMGYWLGGLVRLPAPTQPEVTGTSQPVTITRLQALLSYPKLRGKGIHLSDIFLFGSYVDIDTRD